MDLIELYKKVLPFFGMSADSDGYISNRLSDIVKPTFVDGKRLCLPMPERLRAYNAETEVIFHPLIESITGGKSPVIEKLVEIINCRLNFSIGMIAGGLLNIIASEKMHGQLTPDQSQLLLAVKEADATIIKSFNSEFLKRTTKQPTAVFTNIFLNRGISVRGKKYSRVGIVTFPFYREFEGDKPEFARVKDVPTYKNLFKFLFPEIDDREAYNYGTNDRTGPYLVALLQTALGVASCINDTLELYREPLSQILGGPDKVSELIIEADWVEAFKDPDLLHDLSRKVPMQRGNEGPQSVEERQQVQQPQVQQPAPYQPQTYTPQVQQPVYQQQPQYQPPAVVETSGGIDYASLRRANPNIGRYAPNSQPGGYGQPQSMFDTAPSWATRQNNQNVPIVQALDPRNGQWFNAPITHCIERQGPQGRYYEINVQNNGYGQPNQQMGNWYGR